MIIKNVTKLIFYNKNLKYRAFGYDDAIFRAWQDKQYPLNRCRCRSDVAAWYVVA